MTIAIVDDIENMCKSIRGMLKVLEFGKKFHYGYNGSEALKLLQENDVDLLIMDWNMPVMNGIEALGRIREDRKLRDTPVVLVTAEAEREMVAEAAESDIDAYILKPLTVRSLGNKLGSVIERINNPLPLFVHLKKARSHKEAGEFEAAMAELNAALKADPTSSKPSREIGILYFELNDLKNAEKWLVKAASMNRYDVFAFHYLGELYLKKNNIDRAAAYFDLAMKVSPRHVERGIHFGKALIQKGIIARAAKVFDRALTLSGGDPQLQEEVAMFCVKNDAHDYAIRVFKWMLERQPDRSDIKLNLGSSLAKTGNYIEALDCFSEIEEKEPANLEIKFHIAKAYIAINQPLRADRALRDVLAVEPDNAEAIALSKTLL